MDELNNIKTDDRIADILKKLKEADTKADAKFGSSLEQPKQITSQDEDDPDKNHDMLPWFSKSDLDKELLHYIKFDDLNNITHDSIKLNSSSYDLASVKVKKNYICDVDYYKSRHYILYIKMLDSNYSYSKMFSNENITSNIKVESTEFIDDTELTNESLDSVTSTVELTKQAVDDITNMVNDDIKYLHYIIYTDLGVIDFVANQDEVPYPYGELDLNKWFEEVSNYSHIINPSYSPNNELPLNDATSIQNYKYDIITMHRPCLITLDSSEHESNNKICIRLKEQFYFLPLNKLLGCIKHYSNINDNNNFKYFINKYFDIVNITD